MEGRYHGGHSKSIRGTKKCSDVYGLTGGIASGTPTVARLFSELGAPGVDADLRARQVVAPGSPALDEIVREFGSDILLPDKSLDRNKLGSIVFADDEARRKLNLITHPRIYAAGQVALKEMADRGEAVALYEAALIVENKLHHGMQGLIVVSVPPDLQSARLQSRDGISADAAQARLAAQLPHSEQ